ncbi:MAG: EAL domain-containing protein [Eubacteriales bacterium]|nr:EAL domain-containing protein [Eubacteriales bacterium]
MNEKETLKLDREALLEQYEEMKEIAARDSLTRLLNRGALESEINKRLDSMADTDLCALFLVDLDDFKAVNDTLGHQSGDDVLEKTAALLAKTFRSTDVVGGLGGDEFAVFLSGNLTEEMVNGKAQVICDQLQFAMGLSSTITVTASVGIYLSVGKTSFEYMYRSADLALYKAKKNGKQSYCIKRSADGQEELAPEIYTPVNAIRIRSLLDYIDSGVAMIEVGETMKLVYASSAFSRMLGMEGEELAEMEGMAFVHPEERKEMEDFLRRLVFGSSEAVSHVTRVVGHNGEVMWWRIHASRIEYHEKKSVVLITVVDVSDLKEKVSSIQMDKSLFQVAVDQVAQGIWEVDWLSRSFRIIGENKSFPEELTEQLRFPEELIERNWIHPDCAESFRGFAREIFSGRTQGYANFRVKFRKTDNYGWASFSYRTVFDEDGCPARVVGVIEGMKQADVGMTEGMKGAILPESLMESVILQMNGNLTKDMVELCWLEGKDVTGKESYGTCSEIFLAETDHAFAPGGGERLPGYLSRDRLIHDFLEGGQRWNRREYRRIDKNGTIQWVSSVIHLYEDVESGDVHMSLWISELEQRHQWETKYGISIYRDPLTRLYTRSTARELAMRILESRKHKLCAMVLVEINGMAKLYAQSSNNVDEKRKAIIEAFLLAVGTSCIPGHFGTDRYLLFFPEIKSESYLKRKLEQAFLFVRSITSDLVDGGMVRFVAAGICRYQNETDYALLMRKTQVLCQRWNRASGDRVVFADEEGEGFSQIRRSTEGDHVRVLQEEMMRPLSEREKDVAFSFVLEMLNSNTQEEATRCMLKSLGEYYDADRTYVLSLSEDGQVVRMADEWTSCQKHSIQQVVSGMLTEKFPLLERCMREDKPVFLARKAEKKKGAVPEEEKSSWRYAIFPMREDGSTLAYLCIENGRNYISDATLPFLLSSCLLKGQRRCYNHARRYVREEALSVVELPNNSAYLSAIHKFNSDVYSSLGTVSVDVPELSFINGSRGFDAGQKILRYIIQMIADIFGRNMIYRTWDAEFVALCPNTTQQVFYGKCARLSSALTRRYAKEIRVGYAWSDNVFTGKELVEESKTMMKYNNPVKKKACIRHIPESLAVFGSVGEMINAERFTVFFQPKVDMETNRLVGAEALVRGLDEEGKLIFPVQFVEAFEKEGTIRDLDLYVLACAMKTLDGWRREGKELVPISVNFSRGTLLDLRIRASVLAIQSRYPELSPDLIELEITESAGIVSYQTLAKAMEGLREYGVTFALDNFGSKYANLAIFANVDFDTVKLDRSLIGDIVTNENSRMIIRDIVGICNRKKIRCIAEGVETKEQIDVLLDMGCRCAQGYYYDRPLPERLFFHKYIDIGQVELLREEQGGDPDSGA